MFTSWAWLTLLAFWLLKSTCCASVHVSQRAETANQVGSVVSLDYGKFRGLHNETSGIIYFRGVRFADPPIGQLRWKKPVFPPSKQLGNVDATEYGQRCVSTTQKTVASQTSEDCLFANIYIPLNTTVDNKLPVLVWFHGGGYQSGSTHTAPPELLFKSSAKPFILASFEYRLGQFGFLAGSTIKGAGNINAGLLDQRAALSWVQRYIQKFGGDPSRVTIWGQSAGAGSVMYHLMANGGDNSEKLFSAAIADSPPLTYMPGYNDTYTESIFQQFVQFSGCDKNTAAKVMSCLRSASSNTLASAGSQILAARPKTLYVFAPVLDYDLLQQRPVEAFTSGAYSRVPLLVGSNTDEGANWSSDIPDPSANTSMPNATESTVMHFLQGQYDSLTPTSFDGISKLYPISAYNGSYSLKGQQMYGELRYICSAIMMARKMAQEGSEGGSTSYQYRYNNPHLGSQHHFELQAYFEPPAEANDQDEALFETMRQYLTSFVTEGRPIAAGSIPWTPSAPSSGSPRILLQPGGVAMEEISDELEERCRRWHDFSQELRT